MARCTVARRPEGAEGVQGTVSSVSRVGQEASRRSSALCGLGGQDERSLGFLPWAMGNHRKV